MVGFECFTIPYESIIFFAKKRYKFFAINKVILQNKLKVNATCSALTYNLDKKNQT